MKQPLFYSQRNKTKRLGFTLIEMMFALSILGVMIVILYNALFTVVRSVKIVQRSFETPSKVLMLSNLLEKELTGIYLPEVVKASSKKTNKPKVTGIKEKMVFGLIGKNREINFTSLIPMKEDSESMNGDILEIGYKFDRLERKLVKRIDPVIDDKLEKGGKEIDLPFEIGEMKFEYYDKKWRDQWNSTKSKKLPRAIKVSFTLSVLSEKDKEEVSDEVEDHLNIDHQIIVLLPNAADNKKL